MARPKLEITPEQQARIDLLVKEGLPTRWIAEDVNLPYPQLREILRNDPVAIANGKDYNKAWTGIRPKDTLRKWHFMFAPPSAVI